MAQLWDPVHVPSEVFTGCAPFNMSANQRSNYESLLVEVAACRHIVEDYCERLDKACVEYHETGKTIFPELSHAEEDSIARQRRALQTRLARAEPQWASELQAIEYVANDEAIIDLRAFWIQIRSVLRSIDSRLRTRLDLESSSFLESASPSERQTEEVPTLIQNVLWFFRNWREYKFAIACAFLFLFVIVPTLDWALPKILDSFRFGWQPIGHLKLIIANHSSTPLTIDRVGNIDVYSADSPDIEIAADTEIVELTGEELTLSVPPKGIEMAEVAVTNEKRLRWLVDSGKFKFVIWFRAVPESIVAEPATLSQDRLDSPILISYTGASRVMRPIVRNEPDKPEFFCCHCEFVHKESSQRLPDLNFWTLRDQQGCKSQCREKMAGTPRKESAFDHDPDKSSCKHIPLPA